ncbi:MAG: quinolinate synthase NadA [Comamonadaceae bacterium]|nr:quinolinate synthase NadA [Comamonadaceae bacterium]
MPSTVQRPADDDCQERIRAARARLGKRGRARCCHHYQRADVYQHADLTGDSLKLSRLAAQTDAEYIVFCGVHFMAEVADILSQPEPDRHPARPRRRLLDGRHGQPGQGRTLLARTGRSARRPDEVVTPVTYINSAADLKAFCGEHGGIVCTSSATPTRSLEWSFARREKVLFFPDQHLGRWSGHKMGIPLDEMVVWDPDLEMRRPRPPSRSAQAQNPAVEGPLLGAPDVPAAAHPDASATSIRTASVISHPECSFEVCRLSDHVGSTEHIIKTVKAAPPGTRWLVGTELNLVNRLAEEVQAGGQDRPVHGAHRLHVLDHGSASTRSTWPGRLENLAEGKVVNQIQRSASTRRSWRSRPGTDARGSEAACIGRSSSWAEPDEPNEAPARSPPTTSTRASRSSTGAWWSTSCASACAASTPTSSSCRRCRGCTSATPSATTTGRRRRSTSSSPRTSGTSTAYGMQRGLRPRPPRQRHPVALPDPRRRTTRTSPTHALREARPAALRRSTLPRLAAAAALRLRAPRADPPQRAGARWQPWPSASSGWCRQDAPLIIAGDFNDWRNRACDLLAERLGLTEVFARQRGRPATQLSQRPAGVPPRPHLRARLRRSMRAQVHYGAALVARSPTTRRSRHASSALSPSRRRADARR